MYSISSHQVQPSLKIEAGVQKPPFVQVSEDAIARRTEFGLNDLLCLVPKVLDGMASRLFDAHDILLNDVLAKVQQTNGKKLDRQETLKLFLDICLTLASLLLSTMIGQRSAPSSENKVSDDAADASIKYNIIGVALFSGTDPFSKVIKGMTHSKTSHVGVILANSENENEWYCFESTGSVDEVLNGQAPHVRITPWNKVVDTYAGKVSYRLAVFEDKERTDSDCVTGFVHEYDQKSYTKNPIRLLKALLKKNKEPKAGSLDTVFCSELAAKMFMDLEILEKGMAAGNYIPKDFSSQGVITLKSGISLTPSFIAK